MPAVMKLQRRAAGSGQNLHYRWLNCLSGLRAVMPLLVSLLC